MSGHRWHSDVRAALGPGASRLHRLNERLASAALPIWIYTIAHCLIVPLNNAHVLFNRLLLGF